ncbi:transcriptional regulator [Caballeronia calidae]|uniref:Transcriptional regulator n=2 Tax=Caballeronia calidae TaxID=1777139 RepID=A0A158EID3_9BURK|nr:transcriptional regulator [Caballeronia calidae]
MAQAEALKGALHAAHLVIEGPSCPTQRCFHALDYFYDPAQALQYAIRWGRIWVDHRLTKDAARRVLTISPASSREVLLKGERADQAGDHE